MTAADFQVDYNGTVIGNGTSVDLVEWSGFEEFATRNTDLTNPDLPVTVSFDSPIDGATTYLPGGSISPTATYGTGSQLNLNVPDQVMLVQISVPEPAGMMGLMGIVTVILAMPRRSRAA